MPIFFENIDALRFTLNRYSKVFVLVDENTRDLCLPFFIQLYKRDVTIIEIQAGEQHKNLQTISNIWVQMLDNHADRNSFLVNLGGGVISDCGGFAASCFKRGFHYINVPTTLLAMIDASLGGKTGFDFQGYKNIIGLFSEPQSIFVFRQLLHTLPQPQLISGMAELIKYGFVFDTAFLDITIDNYQNYIEKAANAKLGVVAIDPYDRNERRKLNFGHTLGHALETYFLNSTSPLLHGEAVAVGMAAALLLSEKYCHLNTEILQKYVEFYHRYFKTINLNDNEIKAVVSLILQDKKRVSQQNAFVLIASPGQVVYDVNVSEVDVEQALTDVLSILK